MRKESKVIFNYSALAVAAITLWAGSAQAASTSFLNTAGGLYSTGLNAGGNMLTDDQTDNNYQFALGTGTAGTGTDTAVGYNSAQSGGFTTNATAVTSSGSNNGGFSSTQWVGYNTSGQSSTWVSVNSTATATAGINNYFLYRTTFNLTGLDLSSISISGAWASDNRGRGIYVNGVQVATLGIYGGAGAFATVNANNGNSSLTNFSITSTLLAGLGGSFLSGSNTIEFLLLNNNDDATGLRVEFSQANGNTAPIPVPSALVLMGVGMLGLSLKKRKIC